MDQETNPNAQGQPAQADGVAQDQQVQQAQPEQVPQGNPFEGVQKRFDELTSVIHSQKAQLEEQRELVAALIQGMQAQPAQQQPQQYAIPEGVDPEQYRLIAQIVRQNVDPVVGELKQTVGYLRSREVQQEYQQTASVVKDQQVIAQARELAKQWKSRPDIKGFDERDALIYAAGLKYVEEQKQREQSRDQRGRFNSLAQTVIGSQSATAVQDGSQNAVPKDIDSWPAHKQAEYWAARLGDKPF